MEAEHTMWRSTSKRKDFGIDGSTAEGQQALIQIAKVAAKKQSGFFISNMLNFGIDTTTPAGQKAMIELAHILVKKERDISQHIEDFE